MPVREVEAVASQPANRREAFRLATTSFVALERDGQTDHAYLVDVTAKGAGLSGCDRDAEVGDSVKCSFNLPTGEVDCIASVIWVRPDRQSFAIRFDSVSPDSRDALDSFCDSPF